MNPGGVRKEFPGRGEDVRIGVYGEEKSDIVATRDEMRRTFRFPAITSPKLSRRWVVRDRSASKPLVARAGSPPRARPLSARDGVQGIDHGVPVTNTASSGTPSERAWRDCDASPRSGKWRTGNESPVISSDRDCRYFRPQAGLDMADRNAAIESRSAPSWRRLVARTRIRSGCSSVRRRPAGEQPRAYLLGL